MTETFLLLFVMLI